MMKKSLFLIALALLGICNLTAQFEVRGTQVILTRISSCMPLDDNEDGKGGETDPTRFRVDLWGNDLSIGADTGEMADVLVTNNTDGSVVANQEFFGTTMLSIPTSGSYTVYVHSAGTTMQGQFTIK